MKSKSYFFLFCVKFWWSDLQVFSKSGDRLSNLSIIFSSSFFLLLSPLHPFPHLFLCLIIHFSSIPLLLPPSSSPLCFIFHFSFYPLLLSPLHRFPHPFPHLSLCFIFHSSFFPLLFPSSSFFYLPHPFPHTFTCCVRNLALTYYRYRADVHAATVRCRASNLHGVVVSPPVTLQAGKSVQSVKSVKSGKMR